MEDTEERGPLPAPVAEHYYMVTAHKSTAVTHCVQGDFFGDGTKQIVLAKTNRLELQRYDVQEGVMKLVCELPVFGRVADLCVFPRKDENRDGIVLLTDQLLYSFLVFDLETSQFEPVAVGDVHERVSVRDETDPIVAVDRDHSVVAFRTHKGLIKVGRLDAGTGLETFTSRLDTTIVLDMCCVVGCDTPTLAVLGQDASAKCSMNLYQINFTEKTLQPGPWPKVAIEPGACLFIPMQSKGQGVVIVGEHTISHCWEGKLQTIPMQATIMKCWAPDHTGTRYLLADYNGVLSVLFVNVDPNLQVTGIRIERLGETTQASCLSLLSPDTVFVGSTLANSNIFRINSTADASTDSYLSRRDTFQNLGPVMDFCVVDYEGLGQGQVVTCSNHGRDGSLRVVRNGIGVTTLAEIDLAGLSGAWSLETAPQSNRHHLLCLSTVTQTFFMVCGSEDDLEVVGGSALATDVQSVLCATVKEGVFVQATSRSVRLIGHRTSTDSATPEFDLLWEWLPSNGQRINVGACNSQNLLVGLGGGLLVLLDLHQSQPVVLSQHTMPHEVACVSLSPPSQSLCAVGLWTSLSLHILSVPTLQQLTEDPLGSEVLPRSLVFSSFDHKPYLLCALGDGSLIHYQLAEGGVLKDRRKVALGTKPILLVPFTSSKGGPCVFAACDHPAVIYSSNGKMCYSPVNIKDINHICPFNTESFSDSLVMVTDTTMTIGSMDDIQKLHIRSIPLGATPIRLAHMPKSSSMAVLVCQTAYTPDYDERDQYSLRLLQHKTFDVLDEVELPQSEDGLSLCVCLFAAHPRPLYAVGSATFSEKPDGTFQTSGHVRIYDVIDGKLQPVMTLETSGEVYSMVALDDRLAVGIDGKVHVYTLSKGANGDLRLSSECSLDTGGLCLNLESSGDRLVAGDQLKSVVVLQYDRQNKVLQRVAGDTEGKMVSSVGLLSSDRVVVADKEYNMLVMAKGEDGILDEDKNRLEVVGAVHTGEFINAFRKGTLVLRQTEEGQAQADTRNMIFATVSGALGILVPLSVNHYGLLKEIQQRMARAIATAGTSTHKAWRSYRSGAKVWYPRSFIDGDIIEGLLDMSREKIAEIIQGIALADQSADGTGVVGRPITVDEVLQLVEGLSRTH